MPPAALAVTSEPQPAHACPADMMESGFPGFQSTRLDRIAGAARKPPDIMPSSNGAVNAALTTPR